MVKRTCPICGLDWYSANSSGTWICPECQGEIGPEETHENSESILEKN